MTDRPLSRNLC